MIITRAWDCGCQGWDICNRSNTKSAHAKTLLSALWLYITMGIGK